MLLMSICNFSASYFNPIVDFLVKNFSYVRGQNIRGAPYDFRKAPSEFSVVCLLYWYFTDFAVVICQ